MYDFYVKLQLPLAPAEADENLMPNILNSSRRKLCVIGVDFLLSSCNDFCAH